MEQTRTEKQWIGNAPRCYAEAVQSIVMPRSAAALKSVAKHRDENRRAKARNGYACRRSGKGNAFIRNPQKRRAAKRNEN